MAAQTYPVAVISKLLDLTPRRVQHLANEGVIPRAEKGRYELVPAVRGYIRYLRDRAVGRDGVVIPDIASERGGFLRELNRDTLNELAAFDFAGIIRGVGEGLSVGGNGAQAPAGPDGEPVGGRVSRPVPGEQRGAREVEHV